MPVFGLEQLLYQSWSMTHRLEADPAPGSVERLLQSAKQTFQTLAQSDWSATDITTHELDVLSLSRLSVLRKAGFYISPHRGSQPFPRD